MSFTESFIQAVINTSILEWLGVSASIIYVVLAAFRNIWCWPFGFLSSSIYVYICYSSNLYLETGLQVFYVGMAIYGWLNWVKQHRQTVEVIHWKLQLHLGLIAGGLAITFGLGYYFQLNTNQASPYLDAAITVFSFAATWMTARRVVEGWIYWIIVDFSAIFLYGSRDLYLSAFLYFIFTVMSVSALIQWQKQFKSQKKDSPEVHRNENLIDADL